MGDGGGHMIFRNKLAQSVARWISNPGGVTRVSSGPGGGVPTVIISSVFGLGTLSLASSVGWRRKSGGPVYQCYTLST